MNKTVVHNPGFGLGLRPDHFMSVLDTPPQLDWFEVISENFFVDGGKPRYFLAKIAEQYPIAMHGVSMSIASVDDLDIDYLTTLKKLAATLQPIRISDHLCWTKHGGTNSHDLLPIPYTDESFSHVKDRVNQVQDILERQLVLENVSSYLTFKQSIQTEAEFLQALADTTGCGILLDVNNIYVSARNFGDDPYQFIDTLSAKHVQQIHVAGHSDYGDYCIDTHDMPVCNEVFELYGYAIQELGMVDSMIERDDNIPEFSELLAEVAQLREIATRSLKQSGSAAQKQDA